MTPGLLFDLAWGTWAASWIAAAFWAARDTARQGLARDWLPYTLIVASILVLPLWAASGLPFYRAWDVGRVGAYGLATATIPGFLFTWWARLHLGPLWSAAITRKADHRVVDSGPYSLVRHPIYTGILWAASMTDLAVATAPALFSLVALFSGFWLKARAEERFLRKEIGSEAYDAYRRRVPMLIPRSKIPDRNH